MGLTPEDRANLIGDIRELLRTPEFDLDRINEDVKALLAAPPGGVTEAQVRAILKEKEWR